MKINENFIPERPKKPLKKLKGIIVHWTANTRNGAGASAHWNYFKNNWKIGCTHYVVDDKETIYLMIFIVEIKTNFPVPIRRPR
jgi:N-acetylmuramoyl-L-alanine amidase CwlA